jgi:isochorismate hydrolase
MTIERTAYFTPETMDAVVSEMAEELATLHWQHQALHPERCGLLILDMQQAFLDPTSHAFVPSAPAILPGVLALCGAFADRGRPAVCTQHVNDPVDAGMMAVWWRRLITAASPGAALSPSLSAVCDDVVVKAQYDAFHGTDLGDRLTRRGVEQLLICGVMTHLCCDTTARSAFVRGYEVFVCADATATYTEELHRGSLRGLAHGVAEIVRVREVLAQMEDDARG